MNQLNLHKFRGSFLWRTLQLITMLRSAVYLGVELRKAFRENDICRVATFEEYFSHPLTEESYLILQDLYAQETAFLDRIRSGVLFKEALEIGCAEGHFTELLASRCESLCVLELSPTALDRAKQRCLTSSHVRFCAFDLRADCIPGHFDLVVVTGVLEYFARRSTHSSVREKLVEAVTAQGHLLIGTTRPPSVVDDAWWARCLVRGRWINDFIARHPSLKTVSTTANENFIITLFVKL